MNSIGIIIGLISNILPDQINKKKERKSSSKRTQSQSLVRVNFFGSICAQTVIKIKILEWERIEATITNYDKIDVTEPKQLGEEDTQGVEFW